MALTIASVDAQLLSAHPPSQLEALSAPFVWGTVSVELLKLSSLLVCVKNDQLKDAFCIITAFLCYATEDKEHLWNLGILPAQFALLKLCGETSLPFGAQHDATSDASKMLIPEDCISQAVFTHAAWLLLPGKESWSRQCHVAAGFLGPTWPAVALWNMKFSELWPASSDSWLYHAIPGNKV